MGRKKERSKQGQTNKQGKATQHTQASSFLESSKSSFPEACTSFKRPVPFQTTLSTGNHVGFLSTGLYIFLRHVEQLSFYGQVYLSFKWQGKFFCPGASTYYFAEACGYFLRLVLFSRGKYIFSKHKYIVQVAKYLSFQRQVYLPLKELVNLSFQSHAHLS